MGCGFEVLTADSGAAALQIISERTPRLAILDTGLNDMPGAELLRRIRLDARTRDVRVILVHHTQPADEEVRRGFYYFTDLQVQRPITEDALRQSLSMLATDPSRWPERWVRLWEQEAKQAEENAG